MLAALTGLHVHKAPRYGPLGSFGSWAAFVGTATTLLSTVVRIAFIAATGEVNLLVGILFGVGMLGWLVGFPLLGIATLRANVLPGWCGWLLIAFVPLVVILFLVLLAYGVGGVAVGILWLLLAYGLWSHRSTPVHRERT